MKLKPVAFGLTAGILWGGCVLLTTLLSVYAGYGTAFLDTWLYNKISG